MKLQLEFYKFDVNTKLIQPDEDDDFEKYLNFLEKNVLPEYKKVVNNWLDKEIVTNYIEFSCG